MNTCTCNARIAALERTLAELTLAVRDMEGLVYRIKNERRGAQTAMAVGE